MFNRSIIVVTLLLACAWSVRAAHAGRTLTTELEIPAPVADVWTAFTTADGFASWAVRQADFDFRVGGEMRTSYNEASNLHDEHTIVNKVLAFEPERMLAMQNVQAPKGFANAHLFQETWSVIYFDAIAPDRTHVRIVGMGYGEGPEWDDIYNKFKVGNAYTLEKLRQKFAPASGEDKGTDTNETARLQAVAALYTLHEFVGGEWIHESTRPDGTIFRVRNIYAKGPDGVSLVARGYLGDAEGMFDHGATIIYCEPGTQRTRFFSINEDGSLSQGDIRGIDENTVEWDWNLTALDGTQRAFRVRTHFTDDDHYQFALQRQDDNGAWVEMANLGFERVAEAPEAFRKMKERPIEHD